MKRPLILLTGLFLMSCGNLFNPYKGDFSCPYADKGLCTDPYSAYRLSKQQKPEEVQKVDLEKYVNQRYEKREEFIKREQTPQEKSEVNLRSQRDKDVVIIPPKYVRVLILPYKDETGKTIYKERYVYLLLEDSKLIIK